MSRNVNNLGPVVLRRTRQAGPTKFNITKCASFIFGGGQHSEVVQIED